MVFSDSRVASDDTVTTTVVTLMLQLRNDGRTPARIEGVSSGVEIVGHEVQPETPTMEYIEPLGAGKIRDISLKLVCPGKPKMIKSEVLRVHVIVNYRDIFGSREMRLEYHIEPLSLTIRRFGEQKVDVRSPATWFPKT
jgi:hypothetical protein